METVGEGCQTLLKRFLFLLPHFDLARLLLSDCVSIELSMPLDNSVNYNGAVTCSDALCSVGDVTVGLGIPRPPKQAGRAMRSLSKSLMSGLPVIAGSRSCLFILHLQVAVATVVWLL